MKKHIDKDIDEDTENYEFAKYVFEQEEGEKPNMNKASIARVVGEIEVGIRYQRNKQQNEATT